MLYRAAGLSDAAALCSAVLCGAVCVRDCPRGSTRPPLPPLISWQLECRRKRPFTGSWNFISLPLLFSPHPRAFIAPPLLLLPRSLHPSLLFNHSAVTGNRTPQAPSLVAPAVPSPITLPSSPKTMVTTTTLIPGEGRERIRQRRKKRWHRDRIFHTETRSRQ